MFAPWGRVHIDYASYIDFAMPTWWSSELPEILTILSTDTMTISALDSTFKTYFSRNSGDKQWNTVPFVAIPRILRTKNYWPNPQAPHHSQSNDWAVRFVYTFKRALMKVIEAGATEKAIQKFLLTYETTFHPILGGKVPAELLMGKHFEPSTILWYRRTK